MGCAFAVEENGYPLGIDSSVSLIVMRRVACRLPLQGSDSGHCMVGLRCVAVAASVCGGASSADSTCVHVSRRVLGFAECVDVRSVVSV